MDVIAERARLLVKSGASYNDYKCNQLVNYALNKTKNGRLAKDYLTYGKEVEKPQEGDVVVGKDGKHCGIFVNSNHFVHASSSKQKAVELNSTELHKVFPGGYQIRRNE